MNPDKDLIDLVLLLREPKEETKSWCSDQIIRARIRTGTAQHTRFYLVVLVWGGGETDKRTTATRKDNPEGMKHKTFVPWLVFPC